MTMDHQILKYKIIVKLLPKNQPEVFLSKWIYITQLRYPSVNRSKK